MRPNDNALKLSLSEEGGGYIVLWYHPGRFFAQRVAASGGWFFSPDQRLGQGMSVRVGGRALIDQ